MATSAGTTPLIGSNDDDLEGDPDTEGLGAAENVSDNSCDNEVPGKQPLSIKRRIALVGALLLCVFTVFAFAFLLPCHKQRCQKVPVCPGKGDLKSINWTANFSGIIPGLLSLADTTGYGGADILVEFNIKEDEFDNSSFLSEICKDKICRGSGVLAIDGSCGTRLWIFNNNFSFGLMDCERIAGGTDINDRHCLLLEEKVKVVLLNINNGTTKWKSESKANQRISAFKYVNDIDNDGVRDVVFVNERGGRGNEGNINLLSGKTGKAVGRSLPLPEGDGGSNILAVHTLSNAEQFVIIGSKSAKKNRTSLWAISVRYLLHKVRNGTKVIPGIPWGKRHPDTITGFISIFKESLILGQPLLTDLDSDGEKDIVFLEERNGLSLRAMNGNNLGVLWNITVPSAVSIDKLFQVQHSAPEGNSTDVALLVKHGNHSCSLMVIAGLTGKTRWSFESSTGFPVAPVPVQGLSGVKQAFVLWLSKAEAMRLFPRSRKSREIQPGSPQDQNAKGHTATKTRKRLSSILRKEDRDKRLTSTGMHLKSNPEQFSHHNNDDNRSEKSKDDDNDLNNDIDFSSYRDEVAGILVRKFDLDLDGEIERKGTSDSLVAMQEALDAWDEKIKTGKALLFPRNEYIQDPRMGSNKESFYDPKNSFHFLHNAGIISQQTWERKRQSSKHDYRDLAQELRDLANQKQDEDLALGVKKEDETTYVQSGGKGLRKRNGKLDSLIKSENADHKSSLSSQEEELLSSMSIQKKSEMLSNDRQGQKNLGSRSRGDFKIREMTLGQESLIASKETVRESAQDILQRLSANNMLKKKKIPFENDRQDNLNVGPAEKPSFHKRSVGSSQPGSQCIKSSNDDADSYVAVLLIKDAEGRQHLAEITEERPLYLDAEEYERLFIARPSSCLRLIPSLQSEPVLRDTEEGLDLVYTVTLVSEGNSHHVGKVRKMTMSQVFQNLEGLKTVISKKQISKRENDYSISFPRIN